MSSDSYSSNLSEWFATKSNERTTSLLELQPIMTGNRDMYTHVMNLWSASNPKTKDEVRRVVDEIQDIDFTLGLHLVDLRPDNPSNFTFVTLRQLSGIWNPFGQISTPHQRLGDFPDHELLEREVFPRYVEVRETAEIHLSSMRGRVSHRLVSYNRLVLPVRTRRGPPELALSVIDTIYSQASAAPEEEEVALTKLERAIVRLVRHGYHAEEIASQLALPNTAIEQACGRVVEVLGARNIVHAAALAVALDTNGALDMPVSSAPSFRRSTLLNILADRQREGIFVVDRRSKVLYCNHAAKAVVATGGLGLSFGSFHTERPALTSQLRGTVAECASSRERIPRYVAVPRDGDRPPLSLLVCRLPDELSTPLTAGPLVAIFMVDPESQPLPTSEQLRQQFGLTQAEAVVALEVLSADGVPAVADRLGIAVGTVKTHLLRIFAKTGTCRQAHLVRLLLSLRHGMLEDDPLRGR